MHVCYTTWRYHTDPAFREKMIRRVIDWRCVKREQDEDYDAKLKSEWREYSKRRYDDPEKRQAKLEYQRQYYARKKAEKQQQQHE
jgi:hypothetical protein